ncbi:MAG: DUF3322 domain-containing protein [Cyanobacteria bacterium J06621_11]
MISPEDIKKKAKRQYEAFLRAVVAGTSFFPIEFPVGSRPRAYLELRKAVTALINSSKSRVGFGYTLELETKNTRKHGHQSLPHHIFIENETDYLKLLDQEGVFADFKADVDFIQSTMPQLREWTERYPLKIVAHHGDWPDLLKVCDYFQQHPQPNLYIRELPITVHTKFIEERKEVLRSLLEALLPADQLMPIEGKGHTFEKRFSLKYREPLLSIRILDPALQKQAGFPVANFSLAVSDFTKLQLGQPRCFVTENAMPFLTLPPLKNSVAILGGGYAVSLLKPAKWLEDCSIFYWGDIDVDGFRILAQLRSHFPNTKSILMDKTTYQQFKPFWVVDRKPDAGVPLGLTEQERALYLQLAIEQKRLEQERIDQAYVNHFLSTLEH